MLVNTAPIDTIGHGHVQHRMACSRTTSTYLASVWLIAGGWCALLLAQSCVRQTSPHTRTRWSFGHVHRLYPAAQRYGEDPRRSERGAANKRQRECEAEGVGVSAAQCGERGRHDACCLCAHNTELEFCEHCTSRNRPVPAYYYSTVPARSVCLVTLSVPIRSWTQTRTPRRPGIRPRSAGSVGRSNVLYFSSAVLSAHGHCTFTDLYEPVSLSAHLLPSISRGHLLNDRGLGGQGKGFF